MKLFGILFKFVEEIKTLNLISETWEIWVIKEISSSRQILLLSWKMICMRFIYSIVKGFMLFLEFFDFSDFKIYDHPFLGY